MGKKCRLAVETESDSPIQHRTIEKIQTLALEMKKQGFQMKKQKSIERGNKRRVVRREKDPEGSGFGILRNQDMKVISVRTCGRKVWQTSRASADHKLDKKISVSKV